MLFGQAPRGAMSGPKIGPGPARFHPAPARISRSPHSTLGAHPGRFGSATRSDGGPARFISLERKPLPLSNPSVSLSTSPSLPAVYMRARTSICGGAGESPPLPLRG
ncbi:hypothetical protein NL676_001321 [Syzygium grande]|nr:hypothetical protein NL676_001321 [Syzygium grande]